MVKFLKISILVIVAILACIIFTSYIIWLRYPTVKLNILVLDKTVHNLNYSQHRSFIWVLNNSKILKRDGSNYNVASDYYGFQPITPISEKQYNIQRITLETIDSLAISNDVAYITDTYGVYFNEWFRGFRKGGENSVIEGGINQNDFLFMKGMKERNKLLIGEYNILWGTTSDLNRYKTEELFGIRATGWCGKYFPSLDTINNDELDELSHKYKSESGKTWDFSGSGIVLINRNRVVVLEANHLESLYPVIYTSDSLQKFYNLPAEIGFQNWFEINTAPDSMKIISQFKLKLSHAGKQIFDELGLMPEFPAVSCYNKNGKNIFYFSADFSNNKVITFFSRMANSRKMLKKITFDEKKAFFNEYYFPLLENILLKYSEKISTSSK